MEPKGFTHTELYEEIVQFFQQNEIPYQKNMVGFASDGASVLMGSRSSVKTLLKNDIPKLFVMKCICHSLALAASHATETLPIEVENLLRDVYSYIKYSSKRKKNFEEIKHKLLGDGYNRQLLRLCRTRWLATRDCVARFIELYPALVVFFLRRAEEMLRH